MTSRLVVAPNWLGDCVMAVPVLRAIRRAHPQDGLAVLARGSTAGLLRAEGSADTVLDRSSLFGDVRKLKAKGFDEAWLLPNSLRSALAPFLAGIPRRIGYATDSRGPLLTHGRPRRRGRRISSATTTDCFGRAASSLTSRRRASP